MRAQIKIIFFFVVTALAMPVYGGNPTAYLNFASFTTPGGQNYFETYLSVVGNTFNYVKNKNNKYVAKAHVIIAFKAGDSVVASANFNIVSPQANDSLTKPDFIDVHRFWLPKGNYSLVFTLDDPNDASHKTVSGKQAVRVGYPADSVSISDAEFLESYTPSNQPGPYNKCGFDMIPYVFGDYPQTMKKLCFYCEIYHTAKLVPNQKITIKYSIEDDGTYSLNEGGGYSSSVQRDADTVIPFLAQIPIDKLPSGNYYLHVSVFDINNHQLAEHKYSFTRQNPAAKLTSIPAGFAVYMETRDTLEESIRCLAPISKYDEQNYVISDSLNSVSMPELKHFFYYFWLSRDSVYPLEAWQKYLGEVLKVNHTFGTRAVKGYRTDRGRVYLQYGPPNIRDVETNNPQTYPHEIWEYYRLPDGQTDAKFVFYSPVIETNNYMLLHSTVTGETQNPQWQIILYSRNRMNTFPNNDIDNQTIPDELGEDVNDEFNNPH